LLISAEQTAETRYKHQTACSRRTERRSVPGLVMSSWSRYSVPSLCSSQLHSNATSSRNDNNSHLLITPPSPLSLLTYWHYVS